MLLSSQPVIKRSLVVGTCESIVPTELCLYHRSCVTLAPARGPLLAALANRTEAGPAAVVKPHGALIALWRCALQAPCLSPVRRGVLRPSPTFQNGRRQRPAKIIALLEELRRNDPNQGNDRDEMAEAMAQPAVAQIVLDAIRAAEKAGDGG
jgi:hypothetical protein